MFTVADFLADKLHTRNQELIAEGMKLMQFYHYSKGEFIVKTGEPIGMYRFLASEGVVRCIYHTARGKEITECIVSKVYAQCGAGCALSDRYGGTDGCSNHCLSH